MNQANKVSCRNVDFKKADKFTGMEGTWTSKMMMEGLVTDYYWLKACLLLSLLAAYNEIGLLTTEAACVPETGCNYSLAFYTIQRNDTVSALSQRFQFKTETLQSYNRNLTNINLIFTGQNIFIPFSCSCTNGQLTHNFQYTVVPGDTMGDIVNGTYEKLSTESAVAAASNVANVNVINVGDTLNIPVKCYCGDPSVNSSYGLFTTYVVHSGDQLSALASNFSVDADLITKYNPRISTLQADQIIFIPARDGTGVFPPFTGTTTTSTGANSNKSQNTGLIVGVVVGALVLIAAAFIGFYFGCKRISKHTSAEEQEKQPYLAPQPMSSSHRSLGTRFPSMSVSTVLADQRSIEFSYEELAAATHNFNLSHKIGQGGFASVYFGLINGQKLAIKKMTLKADKEFMAELKILSNVHHTNLVQLIGYCTTNSLFLVYEYVENGTLDQHLHCTNNDGMGPLTWSQRVQISLDTARGLEYIHEHTKPTYVHRDIKSANILIDNNFRAKVADFGLTKLTEDQPGTGGVVGTFGYMSPEYALYNEVSSKLDVYAFGVVLFEIISGKPAILPAETAASPQPLESRTLVHLVLEDPSGQAYLHKYVDPALNGDYPVDSMWKIAQLAGRCTKPTPGMRPTMRGAVLQLMTLASTIQEWEVNFLGSNSALGQGTGR